MKIKFGLFVIPLLFFLSPVMAQDTSIELEFDTAINSLAWNSTGDQLAISADALYIYDLASNELTRSFEFNLEDRLPAYKIEWSLDGRYLAFAQPFDPNASDSVGINSVAELTVLALGGETRVVFADTIEGLGTIRFSNDSTRLVYSSSYYMGNSATNVDVHILDLASGVSEVFYQTGWMGAVVWNFTWSPDNDRLAFDIGGMVEIIDVATAETLIRYHVEFGGIGRIQWNADGNYLLTIGSVVRQTEVATGRTLATIATPECPESQFCASDIRWNEADNTLMYQGNAEAQVVDFSTGQLLYALTVPNFDPNSFMRWSLDGSHVAQAVDNVLIISQPVISSTTPHLEYEIDVNVISRQEDEFSLEGEAHWSSDGSVILTTANSILNLSEADSPLHQLNVNPSAIVTQTVFSPSGRWMAFALGDDASRTYSLHLWNTETGEIVDLPLGHTGKIDVLTFSTDERLLASGSRDMSIRIWDVENQTQAAVMWGHYAEIADLDFNEDGTLLASVADETMRVWDTSTGEQIGIDTPYSEYAGRHTTTEVDFSSNYVVYRDINENEMMYGTPLIVWDVSEHQKFSAGSNGSQILFSADGNYYGLLGDWPSLFDVQNDERIPILYDCQIAGRFEIAQELPAEWMVFNAESTRAAVVVFEECYHVDTGGNERLYEPNSIWILDLQTHTVAQILQGNPNPIYRVEFSPDGTQLLSQSIDGSIRLWDVEAGTLLQILREAE